MRGLVEERSAREPDTDQSPTQPTADRNASDELADDRGLSRQFANDSLKGDSIFGPSVPVGRVGCYPAGGVQLAAAASQMPLTGPFRTGFRSAQAKETASSNVGVGLGVSAADCG
jgi:hypothetical protein